MSVQCKKCEFAIKVGNKTKCVRWINGGFVNSKKQRLCACYVKRIIK